MCLADSTPKGMDEISYTHATNKDQRELVEVRLSELRFLL